jgi:hypothetical protein
VRAGRGSPTPVPSRFTEVGEALTRHRAVFEDGGVFPAVMLDQVIARLNA